MIKLCKVHFWSRKLCRYIPLSGVVSVSLANYWLSRGDILVMTPFKSI